MVTLSACPECVLLKFSSDITFIDYALDILNDLLAYQGLPDPTNLLVICRELMKNAVVHGNRNEPDKSVALRLDRLDGGRYRVQAEDEGKGFDLEELEAVPAAEERNEAHGFALIRSLAGKLASSEKGNIVSVTVDA